MIRAVLFDVDGTLIRTGGAGIQAFEKALETEFGVAGGVRQIRFAGRTDPSIVREAFALNAIDATAENIRRFKKAYLHWLEKLLPTLPGCVCPGVHEFIAALETLPEPPLIGLLTGNIRQGAELKLGHFSLWDYFRFGAFGDDNECRNELAAIAQRRGSELAGRHLHGHELLVIGDTPLDVKCAQAIGARVLGVATGNFGCTDLTQCGATWAAEGLDKVIAREICCPAA